MCLSGPIIKEKAVEYAKPLGLVEFNANNGRLNFKMSHNKGIAIM